MPIPLSVMAMTMYLWLLCVEILIVGLFGEYLMALSIRLLKALDRWSMSPYITDGLALNDDDDDPLASESRTCARDSSSESSLLMSISEYFNVNFLRAILEFLRTASTNRSMRSFSS